MQCCGGCWGRGNQLSLSSSFSLATERNPHVVTESYRSQVLRGFLFLEEQTSFCSSRFCFCPKNSNNKKAKDSGGGTPDSVGTGFNPLRCLAFSIVCCVGKTDVDNQESFHVVLAVWVSKQLVTFCMEKYLYGKKRQQKGSWFVVRDVYCSSLEYTPERSLRSSNKGLLMYHTTFWSAHGAFSHHGPALRHVNYSLLQQQAFI